MATTIKGFDIPGSSYSSFVHKDYKQERAVRRFLIHSDETNKTQVLAETIALIDGTDATPIAGTDVYPQKATSAHTYAHLPLQTATIRKVGYLLWLVEATYYYL